MEPPFVFRVWDLRESVTCHDAWYAALAEALNAPLATPDFRLAKPPGSLPLPGQRAVQLRRWTDKSRPGPFDMTVFEAGNSQRPKALGGKLRTAEVPCLRGGFRFCQGNSPCQVLAIAFLPAQTAHLARWGRSAP
jgi:hypothetical protein